MLLLLLSSQALEGRQLSASLQQGVKSILLQTGSSALTFLQLQNVLQLQSHFFSPPLHPVDLVRATNPWLLLIYNRGKVILIMKKKTKKTSSIFSDTKIQFIIEINDTFILYRDEVSILQ